MSNSNFNVLSAVVDIKQFSFHREKVIRYLFDKGVVFLSLSINCSLDYNSFPINDHQALLRAEQLIKDYANEDLLSLDLIDFASLNSKVLINEHHDKKICVYGLVGYRSLVEFNESFLYRIKEGFHMEPSLSIYCLENFQQIVGFWNFMVEGTDLKNFYIRSYTNTRNESIFCELQDFLLHSSNSISVPTAVGPNSNFDFYKNHRDANIDGLNFRILHNRSVILLNLIKVFMQENNMFIDSGWIYQKDLKNSNLEYKVLPVDNLFELFPDIIAFLYHRFPYQLEPSYIKILFLEFADLVLAKIKKIPSFLPQRSLKSNLLQPFNFPGRSNDLSVDGFSNLDSKYVLK